MAHFDNYDHTDKQMARRLRSIDDAQTALDAAHEQMREAKGDMIRELVERGDLDCITLDMKKLERRYR